MKSQTSLVAKQFRLQTWAAQIQACQNRPEGMLVEDWRMKISSAYSTKNRKAGSEEPAIHGIIRYD